ncbi:MAG: fibronectin type III domain-containing protein, partial [Cyclobacteriaceae bacterium]
KLYETTGVIEYLYETMNRGTHNFSYTVGVNASSVGNPPTASQLKTQQVANTANFSSSPQNNLSTMPAANSRIRFTPPTATPPSGTLSIGSISNTGMTLNWPNWATNETGYLLFYSTDNLNYYFYSQAPINATSNSVVGLLPNTTYYWRVYAVTEGALSAPLSANASTLAAGTVTSITSGRWDRTNTWDCGCIPSASDNVIIQNSHTVSLRSNSDMECNDLTIGQGVSGTASFTTNTARTLRINGNLIINSGAALTQPANSNATHNIFFRGNIINNGTLNLSVDANSQCNSTFVKTNGNQTISGSGPTAFFTILIDKGSKSNILDVLSLNFSCAPDALTFVSGGTFKFSSLGTNVFQLFNTTRDILNTGRIWMNSATSTMSFGAGINLLGDFQLDNGIVIVGNAANENIISFGGRLQINGGAM